MLALRAILRGRYGAFWCVSWSAKSTCSAASRATGVGKERGVSTLALRTFTALRWRDVMDCFDLHVARDTISNKSHWMAVLSWHIEEGKYYVEICTRCLQNRVHETNFISQWNVFTICMQGMYQVIAHNDKRSSHSAGFHEAFRELVCPCSIAYHYVTTNSWRTSPKKAVLFKTE